MNKPEFPIERMRELHAAMLEDLEALREIEEEYGWKLTDLEIVCEASPKKHEASRMIIKEGGRNREMMRSVLGLEKTLRALEDAFPFLKREDWE